jgi:hypothetical protein
MRVSVLSNDSGYRNHATLRANGKRAHVTLNGEHQYECITADSEVGMVVRYLRNAAGALIVDRERERVVDEVVHGKVEIEIIDEMVL